MKTIAAVLLAAGTLFVTQSALALEPWHDQLTAKWAKEKASKASKARAAASKVESRKEAVRK